MLEDKEPMKLLDLHTHSTASDGSLTPRELVRAAKEARLKAVALTDHDTVSGLPQFVDAGQEMEMEVVPGVEIAIQVGLEGGLHLLGLWVDHQESGLVQGLDTLQKARKHRNSRMIRRLNGLGIDLTLKEVRELSGGQVGRPHFAKALVGRGVVGDVNQAFGRYLGAGRPAYVAKEKFAAPKALAMVRRAGGLPVLAHPGMHGVPLARMEEIIKQMIPLGLEGIEALYPEHNSTVTQRLVKMAGRLGLAVAGGSDFHGTIKPHIRLGVGRGRLRVPATLLGPLKKRRDLVRAAQN